VVKAAALKAAALKAAALKAAALKAAALKAAHSLNDPPSGPLGGGGCGGNSGIGVGNGRDNDQQIDGPRFRREPSGDHINRSSRSKTNSCSPRLGEQRLKSCKKARRKEGQARGDNGDQLSKKSAAPVFYAWRSPVAIGHACHRNRAHRILTP
jgi:hypothetical protein